mmetsp:Transcript_1390/g.3071  ORF Transcript_1390/g.3071 Transcript_1390/m.3071 type:complete len:317 (-) Transcript_1390:2554-3504(-)
MSSRSLSVCCGERDETRSDHIDPRGDASGDRSLGVGMLPALLNISVPSPRSPLATSQFTSVTVLERSGDRRGAGPDDPGRRAADTDILRESTEDCPGDSSPGMLTGVGRSVEALIACLLAARTLEAGDAGEASALSSPSLRSLAARIFFRADCLVSRSALTWGSGDRSEYSPRPGDSMGSDARTPVSRYDVGIVLACELIDTTVTGFPRLLLRVADASLAVTAAASALALISARTAATTRRALCARVAPCSISAHRTTFRRYSRAQCPLVTHWIRSALRVSSPCRSLVASWVRATSCFAAALMTEPAALLRRRYAV